ncbi:hypothetical protein [Mycobacterium uberis]
MVDLHNAADLRVTQILVELTDILVDNFHPCHYGTIQPG